MTRTNLPRALWYISGRERQTVDERFLYEDSRSHVVLGEAGMGKTTLLKQLIGREGYVFCTARALINSADTIERFGDAKTLVIDALDEVSAQREGDAVDLVVRKLSLLDYPRFILSCRVADWRSATALQGLSDLYDTPPLELHLEPLDRSTAVAFLSENLGDIQANDIADHLENHDLAGLWSNPQTLALVETVAGKEQIPSTKGQLFEVATELLAKEHREEKSKSKLTELPTRTILDMAGAVFAALILTGKEAISTKVNASDDDIAMRDLTNIGDTSFETIFDSRLLSALGTDRFTYAHRAIGEFLGARWLASSCDTPRKQRRILELFNGHALVPASLRGIHAWLAWHSADLANSVIAADPMGIVQYGDADRLNVTEARGLLGALENLSRIDPRFRGWDQYRVSGIAQPALLPRIEELLRDSQTAFGLKLLILEGLKGSKLITQLVVLLEQLVLDHSQSFAIRREAVNRLAETEKDTCFTKIIADLNTNDTENNARLSIEIANLIGYDQINDELLLKIVMSQLKRSETTIGVYYFFEKNIPAERIDNLLDGMVGAATAGRNREEKRRNSAFVDLAYGLIKRRLASTPVPADRLWTWLEPLDTNYGSRRDFRNLLGDLSVDLKREIQRHVLIERPGEMTIWNRSWSIGQRIPGLYPDEPDVVALLDRLEPSDKRWRDIVTLIHHDGEKGAAVRRAAIRFTIGDLEAETWLDSLKSPPVPEWQIKEDKRKKQHKSKRERAWAKHRAEYTRDIEAVRRGDYGFVVNQARAYLNLFSDMGEEATDGPGRIREWLGPDLCDASLVGFEAYLTNAAPQHPTATEVAESYAENRRWEAANIIVAALAERRRTGRGFVDLPSERLMAGLFEVRNSSIDVHAGLTDLAQLLSDELAVRGCWEATQRLYFEPQFVKQRQHIFSLHELMLDPRDKEIAKSLALEWLLRFPNMANTPEMELIDLLIGSETSHQGLRSIMATRRSETDLDDERRRNWDAVGLLIDFEQTRVALEKKGRIESELFWHIRARLGNRRGEEQAFPLDTEQLIWILRLFRQRYPMAHRPNAVTSGNTNPWDASDFIASLINRLGNEVSDKAITALAQLRDDAPDGYTETFRVVSAEQKRKRVEADWKAPHLDTVVSAVKDEAPTTAAQLQAVLIEEFASIQRKLRGSDVNWYRDFFSGDAPRIEEDCRDTLLKMLRPLPFEIQVLPEGRLADSKRCDIICLLGNLMVPIEIKGQWNPDLWTAADQQLDRLYTNDWRAERGIYLVLWFGKKAKKRLKRPPDTISPPNNAEDLRQALTTLSTTTREGRTQILVLDLERPN